MFQRAITLAEFSDINEHGAMTGTARAGDLAVTTFDHPALGAVVVIEDTASMLTRSGDTAFVALSERPLTLQ